MEITIGVLGSVTGVLCIFLIWYLIRYSNLKWKLRDTEENYRDSQRNRDYWRRRFNELQSNIETDKEVFLRQFETQIEVGDRFTVPDSGSWKDEFRNTTQRIIDIDFDKGEFTSVCAITGRGPTGHDRWLNKFTQVKDFTWVNNKSRLKHKFI